MTRGGARRGAGRPKGLGPHGEATQPLRIPMGLVADVKKFIASKGYTLPVFSSRVAAGFPSPADDHLDSRLDLNEYLVQNPPATFLVRVSGTSMVQAGIHEDDLLVVDRSLDPVHGRIVVAAVDGNLTVKRLSKKEGKVYLMPENEAFPAIELTPHNDVMIWGVVTNVIHTV